MIDRLLFGEVTSCGHMKFLGRLWKAWLALCRHFLLDLTDSSLPAHWRVASLVRSLQPFASLDSPTTINYPSFYYG